MSKGAAIIYWSGTGSTKMMAEAVLEGVTEAGSEATLYRAEHFQPEFVECYDALAFGCPASGSEELEQGCFEPMFQKSEVCLKGKRIGLFGSYGWGDGEWMKIWEERCRKDGAVLVCSGITCAEIPDDDCLTGCRNLGRILIKNVE